jgi:hypothetical protein
MTRSEVAEGGAAPETKGDAVGATATAGLHSNLGAAGGASLAASAERVNFKVSPSRYNVFRRDVARLKILNSVFLDWDYRVASVSL